MMKLTQGIYVYVKKNRACERRLSETELLSYDEGYEDGRADEKREHLKQLNVYKRAAYANLAEANRTAREYFAYCEAYGLPPTLAGYDDFCGLRKSGGLALVSGSGRE